MRTIIFIEDFATKVVGEEWECDDMLASQLVHEDKVAEYKNVTPPKSKASKFENLNPEM